MLFSNFDRLTKADIDQLISNQVPEGRYLDYKLELPGGTDDAKKEFLADVSSFANSSGGDLVYGISEKLDSDGRKTGLPDTACGLANKITDQEVLRFESSIRDGISPKIPGIRFCAIEGFEKGPVFVIQIPESWLSPHMVTFKGSSKFYARGSAGKFSMDVTQIRAAFIGSESTAEKLKNLRMERVSRILSDDAPRRLLAGRRVIVHIIPLSFFRADFALDLPSLKAKATQVGPISSHGYEVAVNLDGAIAFWYLKDRQTMSYAQFYRGGMIEATDATILGADERESIPTITFEESLIRSVDRYVRSLKELNVPLPLVLMVSLTGVKGLTLGVHNNRPVFTSYEHAIDRNPLFLPEVLIQDYDISSDTILRPIFDAFYNAGGWDRCEHYDGNGKWKKS